MLPLSQNGPIPPVLLGLQPDEAHHQTLKTHANHLEDSIRNAEKGTLSIQLAKTESTCYCPCIIGKAESGACSLAGIMVLGKYP